MKVKTGIHEGQFVTVADFLQRLAFRDRKRLRARPREDRDLHLRARTLRRLKAARRKLNALAKLSRKEVR